jgi:hypothetical protein
MIEAGFHLYQGDPASAGMAMLGISVEKRQEIRDFKGDLFSNKNPGLQGIYGSYRNPDDPSDMGWVANTFFWGTGDTETREKRIEVTGHEMLGTGLSLAGVYGLAYMLSSGGNSMIPFYLGRSFERLGDDKETDTEKVNNMVRSGPIDFIEGTDYYWHKHDYIGQSGSESRFAWDNVSEHVKMGDMYVLEDESPGEPNQILITPGGTGVPEREQN